MSGSSVPMAMVGIREMLVLMRQGLVLMSVPVRLCQWGVAAMIMLMVHIMHVFMVVEHWFMHMKMLMALGHVQPDADGHQQTCQ